MLNALKAQTADNTSRDDVIEWALATASALWNRKNHRQALEWLSRAATAARKSGNARRAAEIARAAAFLTESLANLAEDDVACDDAPTEGGSGGADSGRGADSSVPPPRRSSTRAVRRSAPPPGSRRESEVCCRSVPSPPPPPSAPLLLESLSNASTMLRSPAPANTCATRVPAFTPSFAEKVQASLLDQVEPEEEEFPTTLVPAFDLDRWKQESSDRPRRADRGCFEEAPTLTRDDRDEPRDSERPSAPPTAPAKPAAPSPMRVALIPTSARGDFRLLRLASGQLPPEGAAVATLTPADARHSWVLEQLVGKEP